MQLPGCQLSYSQTELTIQKQLQPQKDLERKEEITQKKLPIRRFNENRKYRN